jgi:hypothetical protein
MELADLMRIAANRKAHYHPGHIRDLTKPHKKPRHIDRPIGFIEVVQERIKERLLAFWKAPAEMYGAIRGKSAKDYAASHQGARLLAGIDIRQCFPSIHEYQVKAAIAGCLGATRDAAELLAALTTVNDHLPQGAKTSSALANMVLAGYSRDLKARLRRIDVVHSIYVDDVALSGARAREGIKIAIDLLHAHGFRVERKKIEIMPRHKKTQKIAGLVASRRMPDGGVSVGRARKKDIRARILRAALNPASTPVTTVRSILGKVQHVESMCAPQGASLKRLASRVLPKGIPGPKRDYKEWLPCDCPLGAGLGPAAHRAPASGGTDDERGGGGRGAGDNRSTGS